MHAPIIPTKQNANDNNRKEITMNVIAHIFCTLLVVVASIVFLPFMIAVALVDAGRTFVASMADNIKPYIYALIDIWGD